MPAIEKCRSLRSIRLLGGQYNSSFIYHLIHCVQVKNPRIIDICIEKIETLALTLTNTNININISKFEDKNERATSTASSSAEQNEHNGNVNEEKDMPMPISSISVSDYYAEKEKARANLSPRTINTLNTLSPRTINTLNTLKLRPPLSLSVSEACGNLLCDYFNYSVPGLRCLSLHGKHNYMTT